MRICPQEMRTDAIARPLEINETEKALRAAVKEVLVCVFLFFVFYCAFTSSCHFIHSVNKSLLQCKTCTKLVTVRVCVSSGKCGEDQRNAEQRCVWWNQPGQQNREEEARAGEISEEASNTAECEVSSQASTYNQMDACCHGSLRKYIVLMYLSRPAFMDEYEKIEEDLQKQYDIYVEKFRNLCFLESQLDEYHRMEQERFEVCVFTLLEAVSFEQFCLCCRVLTGRFEWQEAENVMRMMQHKLREEERDQMRSSCEKNSSVHSHIRVYLWFESALHLLSFSSLQWKMKTRTLMFQMMRDPGATWRSVILLRCGPQGAASWQVCSRNFTHFWVQALYVLLCPSFIFFLTDLTFTIRSVHEVIFIFGPIKQKQNWGHYQYKYMIKTETMNVLNFIIFE